MPAPTDLLLSHLRDVPDFPEPGIVFKDIAPLLGDAVAFATAVEALVEPFAHQGVDAVIGVEARGFILAAPVALALGAGFVPVRKAGKLPYETHEVSYALEYGTDSLEIHVDGVAPGRRVLVVDDVLATGGTAAASAELAEKLGAEVVGFAFLIELGFLGGRHRLGGHRVHAVLPC